MTRTVRFPLQRCVQIPSTRSELTFIVPTRPLERSIPKNNSDSSKVQLTADDIKALPMISDVNLFFEHQRDDPDFIADSEAMIVSANTTLPTFPSTKGDASHRPLAEPTYRGQCRVHVAFSIPQSYLLDTVCGVRSPTWCAPA